MYKINSLVELIITYLLHNNYVPVRNKSVLFLVLILPFRTLQSLFFYLNGGWQKSETCFYLPKVTFETLILLRKVPIFANKF